MSKSLCPVSAILGFFELSKLPPFPEKGVVDGHSKTDGPQVKMVGEENQMNCACKIAGESYGLAVMGAYQFVIGLDLQDFSLTAGIEVVDKALGIAMVQHRIK